MASQSGSDHSGSYRIESLKSPDNYPVWRVQIEDILTDLDLFHYVDGSEPRPALSTTLDAGTNRPLNQAEVNTWIKNDRKALTIMCLRICGSMMNYVVSADTSAAAWVSLQNIFNVQGPMAIIVVHRKLLRFVFVEGEDLEKQIRDLKSLTERLAILGSPLPDTELALTVLTALPDTWDSFISSLDPTTINSANIVGRIIQEDARRRAKQPTDSSTALLTKKNPSSSQSNRRSNPNSNSNTSNQSSAYLSGNSGNRPRSKFKPGVTCFNCWREGHIKPECRSASRPKPPNFGNSSSQSGNNSTYQGNGNQNQCRAHLVELPEIATTPSTILHVNTTAFASLSFWLGDTAAESHISRERSHFSSYTPTPGATVKGTGITPVLGRGTVPLQFNIDGRTFDITLDNVLHVPSIDFNLISLGRLTNGPISYYGKENYINIYNGNTLINQGRKHGNLYHLSITPTHATTALPIVTSRSWEEWHRALGHLNMQQLWDLYSKKLAINMNVDTSSPTDFFCEACIQAKHSTTVQPKVSTSARKYTRFGELFYVDIWGKAQITSLQGCLYYILFLDAAKCLLMIYFMKSCAETLDRLKQLEAWLFRRFNICLETIRVDNAPEFTQGQVRNYCNAQGITIETSSPYSAAQQGSVERKNRTIPERGRAMLFANNLPTFLWQEAFQYAVYLHNRSPTRSLGGDTPYHAVFGHHADLSDVFEFGQECWVLVPDPRQGKLIPKSEKYHFTGLNEHSSGFRYYVPALQQILTSRNVIFPHERQPIQPSIMLPPPSRVEGERSSTSSSIQPSSSLSSSSTSPLSSPPSTRPPSPSPPTPPPAARRTTRQHAPVNYKVLNDTGRITPTNASSSVDTYHALVVSSYDEPQTLQEVMSRNNWPEWKKAMETELAQHECLGTYKLTDLPPDRKPVGCRWVFLIKRDANRQIVKYKARLVAQGFSQIPGQDFFATYAPVMRLESFHVILALAAQLDMEIHQVDVVGAYLNSNLEESIYMKQPPGFSDDTTRVLLLLKAIYGLKQAGCAWNTRLNSILTEELHFI